MPFLNDEVQAFFLLLMLFAFHFSSHGQLLLLYVRLQFCLPPALLLLTQIHLSVVSFIPFSIMTEVT